MMDATGPVIVALSLLASVMALAVAFVALAAQHRVLRQRHDHLLTAHTALRSANARAIERIAVLQDRDAKSRFVVVSAQPKDAQL